jgi:hypothetical protein
MKNRNIWSSQFKVNIRALVSILALACFIVIVYVISFIPFDQFVHKQIDAFSPAVQTIRHYGYIQPQVLDGFSQQPIEGAAVVIPETGQLFVTSEDGLTALIKVPIQEDAHFSEISPKPWGEVTLIIYKEGYVEYVLFHAHGWENQTRKGPKILLFPKVEGEDQEPFSVVEGPHRLWVRDLIEKYRPDR